MNYTDFIIGLITGSVLAIVVFLISRKKDNSTLNIELIQKELEEAHASNKELHARIEHLIATNASNEANLKAAQLAIEEEKALITELKIQLKS
jgi:gas vesicle protein